MLVVTPVRVEQVTQHVHRQGRTSITSTTLDKLNRYEHPHDDALFSEPIVLREHEGLSSPAYVGGLDRHWHDRDVVRIPLPLLQLALDPVAPSGHHQVTEHVRLVALAREDYP